MIWGCLDSKQHMNAARRYLRAEQVYTMLTSSFASDILAKFPLLSHQWPLVEKFKCVRLASWLALDLLHP